MKHVSSKDFEAEVLRSSVPAVVDFYTEGCPPCRQIAPVIEEIEQESTGKLNVNAAAEAEFTASSRVTTGSYRIPVSSRSACCSVHRSEKQERDQEMD